MVVSVAHELGHCFTGYITGDPGAVTPPSISVPGLDGGEAGFYWEAQAFGGVLQMWSDPLRPSDPDQPGIPYLFSDFANSTTKRISTNYINHFVNNPAGTLIPVVSALLRIGLTTTSSNSFPDGDISEHSPKNF